MQSIRALMHADLIGLQGKKHSLSRLLIFIILISAVGGMLLTPYLLPFIMALLALMLPEHVEKHTAGSEKLYGILPVSRKELAASRYLLLIGLLAGLLAVNLLIAAATEFGRLPGSNLGREITALMSTSIDPEIDPAVRFGSDLVWIGAGFLISAAVLAHRLRTHFRTFGSESKKQKKLPLFRKVVLIIGVTFALELLCVLIIYGGRISAVFGRILSLLLTFLESLSQFLNGIPFFVCLVTAGFCAAAYQYVCAYTEFEKKDI